MTSHVMTRSVQSAREIAPSTVISSVPTVLDLDMSGVELDKTTEMEQVVFPVQLRAPLEVICTSGGLWVSATRDSQAVAFGFTHAGSTVGRWPRWKERLRSSVAV